MAGGKPTAPGSPSKDIWRLRPREATFPTGATKAVATERAERATTAFILEREREEEKEEVAVVGGQGEGGAKAKEEEQVRTKTRLWRERGQARCVGETDPLLLLAIMEDTYYD